MTGHDAGREGRAVASVVAGRTVTTVTDDSTKRKDTAMTSKAKNVQALVVDASEDSTVKTVVGFGGKRKVGYAVSLTEQAAFLTDHEAMVSGASSLKEQARALLAAFERNIARVVGRKEQARYRKDVCQMFGVKTPQALAMKVRRAKAKAKGEVIAADQKDSTTTTEAAPKPTKAEDSYATCVTGMDHGFKWLHDNHGKLNPNQVKNLSKRLADWSEKLALLSALVAPESTTEAENVA